MPIQNNVKFFVLYPLIIAKLRSTTVVSCAGLSYYFFKTIPKNDNGVNGFI